MTTYRLVRKAHGKPTGLMVGWLFGKSVDSILQEAFPKTVAIVTTGEGPIVATFADLAQARKLAGVDATVPILLAGFSAGCQAVRSVLLSNLLPEEQIMGVAVFDGTHSTWPKMHPAHVNLWMARMKAAEEGGTPFVGTCTEMVYTKDIKDNPSTPKQELPFAPTSLVLEAALGHELEVGKPVVKGNLYLEKFKSPKDATGGKEHSQQMLTHAPLLLNHMWGGDVKMRPVAEPTPAAPITPETTGPVDLTHGHLTPRQRLLAWFLKELADGVAEVPYGSNRSPRIDQYAGIKYTRKDAKTGKEKALPKLEGSAWCAMMWSYGVLASQPVNADDAWPWFLPRVAGVELREDAIAHGRWHTAADIRAGKYVPQAGDMALFKRPGEAWMTHTTCIEWWRLGGEFQTVAGNEAPGVVKKTMHKVAEKDFLGVIDMS